MKTKPKPPALNLRTAVIIISAATTLLFAGCTEDPTECVTNAEALAVLESFGISMNCTSPVCQYGGSGSSGNGDGFVATRNDTMYACMYRSVSCERTGDDPGACNTMGSFYAEYDQYECYTNNDPLGNPNGGPTDTKKCLKIYYLFQSTGALCTVPGPATDPGELELCDADPEGPGEGEG
jgi:hypothetical protein